MNYLIGIDTSAHVRMVNKYARYFKSRFEPERIERDEHEPRLCVEGIAVLTDEPIGTKTGEIIVIEKGAFDGHFSSHSRTEMWLAHDPTEIICSTASGLEFLITDDGVAFRFPLDNKRYSGTIQRMITSGKQACVSVGITRTKERHEMVGRHKVTFVESATLRECSIVAAGACDQAFARLIDANTAPSLADSIKSVPFKIDSGLHNVKTQREKNATRVDRLRHRLDAMEGGRNTFSATTNSATTKPHAEPAPPRSLTLDELNRIQSAETNRLQQEALQRLSR